MTAPVLVDRRVDWFELRGRVALTRGTLGRWDVVAELRRAAKRALTHGVSPIVLGRLAFGELRAPKRPGLYRVTNADFILEIDTAAREMSSTGEGTIEGWNVRVQWRAAALAERGFDPGLTWAVFAELGRVLDWKVARVDLAATFAGWVIREEDRNALVVRSRASIKRFFVREAANDVDEAPGQATPKRRAIARVNVTMHGGATTTGFTVGEGGDVMGRVYDKIAELVVRGHVRRDPDTGALTARTRKGEIELALWGQSGVDVAGPPPVTRVEFQLRGAALDEFAVRDPRALRARLGPIWRYLVGVTRTEEERGANGWMRLVREGGATRKKRANLDARWLAVRAVAWEGTGEIAQRIRKVASGASWKQAIGASLGALAEAGALPDPKLYQWRDEYEGHRDALRLEYQAKGADPFAAYARAVEEANAARIARLTDEQCIHFVDDELRRTCEAMALLARDSIVAERGPKGAAEWLIVKWEATRVRFGRVRFEEWRAAERERDDRIRTGVHPFVQFAAQMTG